MPIIWFDLDRLNNPLVMNAAYAKLDGKFTPLNTMLVNEFAELDSIVFVSNQVVTEIVTDIVKDLLGKQL